MQSCPSRPLPRPSLSRTYVKRAVHAGSCRGKAYTIVTQQPSMGFWHLPDYLKIACVCNLDFLSISSWQYLHPGPSA
eukprot:7384799-Prymnesium_polylepis.1